MTLQANLPGWVKAGEVFAVDGCNEKIIQVTAKDISVVTWDAFGSWPIPIFVAALTSGRITRSANQVRSKRHPSRPLGGKPRRGRLPEIVARLTNLPIIATATPALIVKSVFLTLRALRHGAPARPPDLIIVKQLAYAGADAEGLGATVAFRRTQPGQSPILQAEAQDAQNFLSRFSHFLRGDGEFELSDFPYAQHLVMRGLEAAGLVAGPRPLRGRPAGTPHEEKVVQYKLSRRWRHYKCGTYSTRQAIREVAEEVVLDRKQVLAAWDGNDHHAVTLEPEDEEKIARAFHQIEVAFYRLPKLTDQDAAAYRGQIATLLRGLRQVKNRLL